MKLLILALLALGVAGCGNTAMLIHNRVACTVSGDSAYIIGSTGGMFGGSAAVDQVDATVICAKTAPLPVASAASAAK